MSAAPFANSPHETIPRTEVLLLSDEQILEIDPDPQDVEVRTQDGDGKSAVSSDVRQAETTAEAPTPTGATPSAIKTETATPDTAAPATPPNANAAPAPFSSRDDVRALAQLYPGGIAQAKSAAERARLLDDIDRAYFGSHSSTPDQARPARAQLAATMLREDPVAFREMVFEGLRALEQANAAPPPPAQTGFTAASSADQQTMTHNAGPGLRTQELKPGATGALRESPVTSNESLVSAYAEFEKAANADLEKSVGGAIERALHQALPNIAQRDADATVGARFSASPSSADEQHSASLQARLSQAIRQDVEKALQGDRQLGEQIAQILAGRRFDAETRAQVVRLINDRAQRLVPVAAKRALNDWTQATLAAHRSSGARADAASSRREVAAAGPVPRDLHANARSEAPRSSTNAGQSRSASKGRVDYRKLSDEQILNL